MIDDSAFHKENKGTKQTVLLLVSMMSVMYLLGWVLGGLGGIIMATIVSVIYMIFNNYSDSDYILRFLKAKPIRPEFHPALFKVLEKISLRAGLLSRPRLYCIPSKMMNAFVIGRDEKTTIVITDSLLKHLNIREIGGILGHEMAHIKNGDLLVMGIADTIFRLVYSLSLAVQLLIFFSLPAVLLTDVTINFIPVFLVSLAPVICMVLMMALSRTREYEADRLGVKLAGDVYGLISALEKLDRYHKGLLSRFLILPWKLSQPIVFRTHPPTPKRIERLISFAKGNRNQFAKIPWQYRAPQKSTYFL